MSDVLVFAEFRNGEMKRPTLEAISVARGLAGSSDTIHVLAIGSGAGSHAERVGRYGAGRLLAMEDGEVEGYAPELYAAALVAAVRETGAGVVLVPATSMGRDVAARAAAKLRAGCVSDVVAIEAAEGGLRARRPVYSGKAYAWVTASGNEPIVVTLRPNVFPAKEIDAGGKAEVVPFRTAENATPVRIRAIAVEKPADAEIDVAEASIVVSGGRGLKAPENFSLIRDLAHELGAAVGASRAVVDSGWIDHAHQVGQTGKVVSPNLYVACGISGAIQHLAGMSSAKVIVAVNKDPDAPIFKVATYGIVGDLFEVVPKITEEVRALKKGG